LSKFSADNFGKTTCRELHHLVCDIVNMNRLHNKFSSSRNSPGWQLKKKPCTAQGPKPKRKIAKEAQINFPQ
jgi:hypothetical protein